MRAGLPQPLNLNITQTKNYFAALENFQRTFAFGQGDKVLLLTDPLLDTRVADAGGDAGQHGVGGWRIADRRRFSQCAA